MAQTLCTTDDQVVWTDGRGTTHWAVGDYLVPNVRGTFVLWTACASADVPANGAWKKRSTDTVTCANCIRQGER